MNPKPCPGCGAKSERPKECGVCGCCVECFLPSGAPRPWAKPGKCYCDLQAADTVRPEEP